MPGKTKSISELRKELKAKTSQLTGLNLRRSKLTARLAAVDRQIAVLTAEPVRRRRKRKVAKKAARKVKKALRAKPGRKGRVGKPLAEYIRGVLAKAKAGMRVMDVTAAVLRAGYRTRDKTFNQTVAKTLATDKRFRRVSHGIYKPAA